MNGNFGGHVGGGGGGGGETEDVNYKKKKSVQSKEKPNIGQCYQLSLLAQNMKCASLHPILSNC